jgi:hypothetical protein
MAFGREAVKDAAVQAEPAEDLSALAESLVRDYLSDLEKKGVAGDELAVAQQAGAAVVRYVETLERMGASHELVHAAASGARDIVAETVGLG